MPLYDISGAEAVQMRKNNPFATWGDRSKTNRVEPVAKPAFSAPFQLQSGEAIFTVGSCFARNVELELMKYGFKVPMRDLFKRPEFAGMDAGIVNNFGTPSIYNEFAWALGEQPLVPGDQFVEVLPGKYADMHVIPSVRAEEWETVLARRMAITEVFRMARDCRVIIMTLGLVEVWFDAKTRYYLNAAPRPNVLRREPERFRLHVLSYEEAYGYLDRTLALIRKHCREDVQVILTVSPVPLTATHRDQDVMVANTYSKSVLRTAAETAASNYDFVTYFPSYECVSLTDRKIAWRDDMVHVTDAIVAINVGRMFEAFVDVESDASSYRGEIAAGGAVAALNWAQKMRLAVRANGEAFFSEYRKLSLGSDDFALEHAKFLAEGDDYIGAIEVLDRAPGSKQDVRIAIATAEAFVKIGQARAALARLDPLAAPDQKLHGVWNGMMNAAKALGDSAVIVAVGKRWSEAVPRRAGRTNAVVGRWFLARGDRETALTYLEKAVGLAQEDAWARIYYAETLAALGRLSEAREQVKVVRPSTPNEATLVERLKSRLFAGLDLANAAAAPTKAAEASQASPLKRGGGQ